MPLITIIGAGPGLGLEIARAFGQKGFDVALVARSQANVDSLAGELVAEGIQAARGVLPVQAEVKGEMVAGAGADHQEGQVVLGRDAGHQRLGSVTPGHAEQVCAPLHRIPGQ